MPFPAFLAPVIAAGVSGAASIVSQAVANRKNVELMREQNRFSLQATREMNSWNHPVNELARLRGAGISPGLMYDNGVSGNVQSSPASAAGTPDIKPLPFMDSFSSVIADTVQLRAQKLNEINGVASRSLMSAREYLAMEQAGKTNAEKQETLELLGWKKKSYEADINYKEVLGRVGESEISLNGSKEKVNDAQIIRFAYQNGYDLALTYKVFYLLASEKANLDASTWHYYISGQVGQRMADIAQTRVDFESEQGWASIIEQNRHNLKQEGFTDAEIDEMIRHNKKTETQHTVDRWVNNGSQMIGILGNLALGGYKMNFLKGVGLRGLVGNEGELYQFGGMSPFE